MQLLSCADNYFIKSDWCEFISSFEFGRFFFLVIIIALIILLSVFRYKIKLEKERAEIQRQVRRTLSENSEEKEVQEEVERLFKEARFLRKVKYWVATFVALVLLVYSVFFALRSPVSSSPEHWGQMGDFFGGMLNPILAFASFIALLHTIRIQSEELRLTREEFTKSVAEQEKIAGSQLSNVSVQREIVQKHEVMISAEQMRQNVSFYTDLISNKLALLSELLHNESDDSYSLFVIFKEKLDGVKLLTDVEKADAYRVTRINFQSAITFYKTKDKINKINRIGRELRVIDWLMGELLKNVPKCPGFIIDALHAELGLPSALYLMIEDNEPEFENIITDNFLNQNGIPRHRNK